MVCGEIKNVFLISYDKNRVFVITFTNHFYFEYHQKMITIRLSREMRI